MTATIVLTSIIALGSVVVHFVSIAVVMWRSKHPGMPNSRSSAAVSIVRPLCGLESFSEHTLGSGFQLRHQDFELLFCVARSDDPVIPLVRRLMAVYPDVRCRLLIGNDIVSANPKLNNCVKGWREAANPWVIIADSNVLMPPDYVRTLFDSWDERTGLVCSPPIGTCPVGFFAELECQTLNTYQARWQLFADGLGLGFAQGKSMLWKKSMLDSWGGIAAVGSEAAEDAAATKLVRKAGLHVRVVAAPFQQPIGARVMKDVWNRQLRWARLRRASFPGFFVAEILSGALPPLLCAVLAMGLMGYGVADIAISSVTLVFCWYGAEAALASSCGWHLSVLSPLAWIARDLAQPALWVAAWIGDGFVWHGHEMSASHHGGDASVTEAGR